MQFRRKQRHDDAVRFEQDALRREPGLLFMVNRVTIDYLAPALFNDAITVTVQLREQRGDGGAAGPPLFASRRTTIIALLRAKFMLAGTRRSRVKAPGDLRRR